MTKIEALELELAARKMVEGTELEWSDVLLCNKHLPIFPLVHRAANEIELALGIIEGKPVWNGDKLFFPNGDQVFVSECVSLSKATGGTYDLSWNPPAKTIMVELLVEDVKSWVEFKDECRTYLSTRTSEACRTALRLDEKWSKK